ncbi:hypothetical protein PAXINDRAFT_102058 [Paxillus involutus ATCC 200175]|uniref:Uncharacterized protein n=1 Tax=Paxillus involutus ATCC 200175 TaxID=664439 RepID=A0A0C9TSU5_PAXIN|nr:hypothetical protein PAXINDRAFT_102058 [Paxillus involutus ATCC 200175]
MRSSTRLIEVSAGAALTKGSHILIFGCWRYVAMTALTWCIFGLFKLLTTGWTTLLMPTLVDCTFDVTGTQLDLANSAFTQLLNTELSVYSNLQIHDDSFPIIDIGSSLSGISAAGTNFGLPGILNFNGAKYNISTGGILPAMPDYTGSTEEPGANYTRMSFAGGKVLVNMTILPDIEAGGWAQWFGVQRNYSVYQQGVTANVSCTLATESGYQMNLSSNFFPLPVPSQTLPYYVWAWESSAICNGGSTSVQQYLLLANSTN